jgi:hypothetical protein
MAESEDHVDWLETQLDEIIDVGDGSVSWPKGLKAGAPNAMIRLRRNRIA